MEQVGRTLPHLYYLYTKSSKKHRKLKNLHMSKDEFEMYTSKVRPVRATGARWIDQKLQAIDHLIETFGHIMLTYTTLAQLLLILKKCNFTRKV